MTIEPSAPGDKFLAISSHQSIDWEWIVDWAATQGLETMIFCRYGENTPLLKAIGQL
jgi:hypothetical protein